MMPSHSGPVLAAVCLTHIRCPGVCRRQVAAAVLLLAVCVVSEIAALRAQW